MDIETSEVIEQVNARIDRLEVTLRTEFRGGLDELREGVDGLREGVAELRTGRIEDRRQAQVLHESLRDDIRMLADGFAVMSAKLDSLQR